MSRRRFSALAAVAAVVALGLTPVLAGPAGAQQESPLGGYSLLARASPMQFTYDSPGLLPVSPIVQFSVPEAYASLASGPTGYGLASLAFPGPLIADLGSAIAQEDEKCRPPFPVPVYPIRAEAFSPQGPADTDTSPVPGTRMHATADGPASGAFGAWNDAGLPGAFHVGSVTGTSSSSGKGESAITKARSVVSGFSMLAGAIEIDSVVTDITATSDGTNAKTSGTTRVGGATIGDQKVTIDEKGVSLAGRPAGGLGDVLDGLGTNLNAALKDAGITIKLIKQFEHKDGGLAERYAGGVSIELYYNGRTAPLISQVLAGVPTGQLSPDNTTKCAPSSPQGAVNLLKETHIESLVLGGASVSSNATAAFELPAFDNSTIPGLDAGGAGLDAGGLNGDLAGAALGGGTGSAAFSQSGSGALAGAGTGLFASGRGIPVALILLLLALLPFLGAMTQRFADAALSPGVATDICPLETEGDRDG
ncbi:MAG: hypothetical protein H0W70_06025 [Actinobacteria bacterium]|nr:hypothetical protein [Actinomycetota bacterium]